MKQSLLNEKLRVLADVREENTAQIIRSIGCDVAMKSLQVGDFVCSDSVVVERKTASDFVSSLVDGRIFEQAKRMREFYERPVFIVEGSIWDDERLPWKTKAGVLSSLFSDFNVSVLGSKNKESTAYMVYSIALREAGLGKKPSLLHVKKQAEKPQLSVICALPGVGEKRAEKLLEKFGTLKELFNASEKELCETLGKKTGKNIFEIINTGGGHVRKK